MIAWLLISFAALMVLGIPIGISLGLAAVGGIVFISGGSIDIKTLTQRMFEGMNSWALGICADNFNTVPSHNFGIDIFFTIYIIFNSMYNS